MPSYNNYISKLKEICKNNSFEVLRIGSIGKKLKFPLYKVIINPHAKRVVCFSAGIHGEEIAGPLTILEFLKWYRADFYPNIKIIIFPVVNPFGFDRKRRLNERRFDLNQSFFNKSLPEEDKIVYNHAKKQKIFFFHAIHEDSAEGGAYLYGFEKRPEEIYKKIISIERKFFPIKTGKDDMNNTIYHGMIINAFDESFESRLFKEGIAKYAVCTETPMRKQPLKKRIKVDLKIVKLILGFVNKK
jgi:hypothetical protein